MGKSEEVFRIYLKKHSDLREKLFLQSKVEIQLYDKYYILLIFKS